MAKQLLFDESLAPCPQQAVGTFDQGFLDDCIVRRLRQLDRLVDPLGDLRRSVLTRPDVIREIHAQPALAPYRGPELAPGESVRSDAEIDAWIRRTVETGYHFSTAQHLAMVINAPEISYGEPSLDRTVATLPVSGNVGGRTRVSILLPGGHYNYELNVNQSTAFQSQVLAGLTPTVPSQSYSWSNANCPGLRYDDPPRLFGI